MPRGGSTAVSYNTTSLIKHMQSFHVNAYQEFMLANRQEDVTQQWLSLMLSRNTINTGKLDTTILGKKPRRELEDCFNSK